MLNRFLPFIFLLAPLCSCPFFEETQIDPATQERMRAQIENVNCDNNRRREVTRNLFEEVAGRENVRVERFERGDNFVIKLPGRGKGTVVVGAHYDKTTLGCGAIDNWSGVVLVANLYELLKKQNPEKTFLFVAFGEEEKGLHGSTAMARSISNSNKANYCAMVNFDSFGFKRLWSLGNASDESLIELGRTTASEFNFSFLVKTFKGASSDSKSFQRVGIPAITLSGGWRRLAKIPASRR